MAVGSFSNAKLFDKRSDETKIRMRLGLDSGRQDFSETTQITSSRVPSNIDTIQAEVSFTISVLTPPKFSQNITGYSSLGDKNNRSALVEEAIINGVITFSDIGSGSTEDIHILIRDIKWIYYVEKVK